MAKDENGRVESETRGNITQRRHGVLEAVKYSTTRILDATTHARKEDGSQAEERRTENLEIELHDGRWQLVGGGSD